MHQKTGVIRGIMDDKVKGSTERAGQDAIAKIV